MNDDTPTIEQPAGRRPARRGGAGRAQPRRPRRLTRSSSDRVLVGVAGGLGRYFGVDPVIFRIGFAALDLLRRARSPRVPAARGLRPDGRRARPGAASRRAPAGDGLLAGARAGRDRGARCWPGCSRWRAAAAFAVALGWGVPVGDRDHRDRRAARPRRLSRRRPLADPAGGGAGGRGRASPRPPTSTSAAGSASASTTRSRPSRFRPTATSSASAGSSWTCVTSTGARSAWSTLKVDLGAGQANVFVPAASLRRRLDPRRRRRERGRRRAKRRSRRRPRPPERARRRRRASRSTRASTPASCG